MIPIGDINPRRRFPWATLLVIVANTLIFLLMQLLPPSTRTGIYYTGGIIPYHLTVLGGWSAWLTILSSMFLHGGWSHLIGNMIFLWVFGDNIEDRFGPLGFLALYLLSGAVAGLTQVVFNPLSEVPIIGASGAISGIAGAYLLLFPKARIRVLFTVIIFWRVVEVRAAAFLIIWFLWQLIQGVVSLSTTSGGGVAWFAHVGGFATGLILAILFGGRRRQIPEYEV